MAFRRKRDTDLARADAAAKKYPAAGRCLVRHPDGTKSYIEAYPAAEEFSPGSFDSYLLQDRPPRRRP